MGSGFTMIDNDLVKSIPSIGMAAFTVYVVLKMHTNSTGIAWPSVSTVAGLAGMTVRSVRRAIAVLQAKGLIQVEHRKDASGRDVPNRYILPPVGESDTKAPLVVLSCQGEGDTNDLGRVTPEHHEQEPIEQEPIRTRHGKAASRFVRPSIEEIRVYCAERKNRVDAQQWFDYYESNGWKVGKNPMSDWKAAVRTWERNGFHSNGQFKRPVEPQKPYRN
jgi:hypothetical protein